MSGETENAVSGWTTDTLKSYMEAQITSLRSALDERYATQTKATDAAFVAQQTAMRTAFDAADKAVQAALAAAEKAAKKAEDAADKRFDAVNEFRGQLADQAATLLSRVEYQAQHTSTLEKIELINSRLAELDKMVATGASKSAGAQSVTGTGYEASVYNQNNRLATAARAKVTISQLIAAMAIVAAIIGPVLIEILSHSH